MDTSSATFTIRFLLFPKGEEIRKEFENTNITCGEIKQQLFNDWPNNISVKPQQLEHLNLIFSGRVIEEHIPLTEVYKEVIKPNEPITIHIFVKRPRETINNNNNINNNSTTTTSNNTSNSIPLRSSSRSSSPPPSPLSPSDEEGNSSSSEGEEELHYHGALFHEDEIGDLKSIFEKKKGEDNKIAFNDLYRFLKAYWKWLGDQNMREPNKKFPVRRLLRLNKGIVGEGDRVTCEQFVQIFFLFDNKASGSPCPHGHKERVKLAIDRLHQNLKPETEVDDQMFNNLFSRVDLDEDNTLSCREMDLILYLYSLEVTDPSLMISM